MRLPFLFALLMPLAAAAAEAPSLSIRVNQAGYLPHAPKLAMVVAAAPGREFTVRRASDGRIVYRGELSAPAADPDSGDTVQTADFSRLRTTGRFYLEVPGAGRSWDFEI